jgi:hypothetical protein
MLGIVIVAEGEGMPRIKPVDLGLAAVFGFAQGDHGLSVKMVALPI